MPVPEGVIVRRYLPEDGEQVWGLHREGVLPARERLSKAARLDPAIIEHIEADLHSILETYLGAGSNFWVAEADGRLVGMVAVQRIDETSGQLRRMRVTRTWRRRGLGRALLATAEEFCRREGYTRIVRDTTPDQLAAQALYEGDGFIKNGERDLGPFRIYDYVKELV